MVFLLAFYDITALDPKAGRLEYIITSLYLIEFFSRSKCYLILHYRDQRHLYILIVTLLKLTKENADFYCEVLMTSAHRCNWWSCSAPGALLL
jgi:hypothetical protein